MQNMVLFLKMLPLLILLLIVPVACRDGTQNTDSSSSAITASGEARSTPGALAESGGDPTPEPTATPTAAPTPTKPPPKELVVCMAAPPRDLYLYGDNRLAATAVRHAIYENLYTTLSYGYQARALQTLPDLTAGDAVINAVTVNAGERVVNAAGRVVDLAEGVTVVNTEGQEVVFEGDPISMQQMVVEFTFKPLVWSDGTPVTAADSVYSFEVAASPDTPSGKAAIARTADYEATGDLSVRWTGIPGYLDAAYFTNVWSPLPRHQLATLSPAELVQSTEASRTPLSSGPFVVESWPADGDMVLVRNPHYYRAEEGLPYVDQVTIKFMADVTDLFPALLSASCDIVTQDVFDAVDGTFVPSQVETETDNALISHVQTRTIFEHIDFGIDSIDNYAVTRPDWFEDVRVRQAIIMCTDRQQMVDEIVYGQSEIMHTYVPRVHPLYPPDLREWPYDPARANALLDEVGFLDGDGDGVREEPEKDRPFRVVLGTEGGVEMRQRIVEMFAEDMATCGIDVEVFLSSPTEWYADGPDGPLFGRRFDLGEFAWSIGPQPACYFWLSSNISGPRKDGFGGWGNVNVTGWSNEAFDAACRVARDALPGLPEYEEHHQEALRIFAEEVPIIPLFLHIKVAATRPDLLNFKPDPSQLSELWNLYELDVPRE